MSVDNDVEEIIESVCIAALANNVDMSYMLAKVVNRALMSDDDDICHVNGIEFMKQCDTIMSEKK